MLGLIRRRRPRAVLGLSLLSALSCTSSQTLSPGTAAPTALAAPTPTPRRPANVLFILTDDQGCGDASHQGNPRLATPNIDALAAQGTVFTRFHVSPVCAPTRAALLTGKYHLRTGVRGVIGGREFMSDEETTVAERLRDAGYHTGIVGKWHLGEFHPWLPRAQGFDDFIGFRMGSSRYFDAELEDNQGRPVKTKGYLTEVLTDHAIDFIAQNRERPFFLYLPYNAPHNPLQVPDRYVDPYRDLPADTAKLYGMMAALDENVGRLLTALDRNGLADDTIVLFTSDNGPLWHKQTRFNCGLRGRKYNVYQGGVRVPLIVRWPGQVPAGRTVDHNTAHVDVLPTLLSLLGLPRPPALDLDGRDLRPLLLGTNADQDESWQTRELFLHYPGEYPLSERAPETPYPGGMMVEGRWKMVGGAELYDLDSDPGEAHNLASAEPARLDRMDQRFRAWFARASQQRPGILPIEIGHDAENPVALSAHVATLTGGPRYGFRNDEDGREHVRDVGVHDDYVSEWRSPAGRITWRTRFVSAGRYDVRLRVRCRPEDAGAVVQLSVGRARVRGTLSACQGAFTLQDLGALHVPAGAHEVTLAALAVPGAAVADLDKLVFERAR